MLKSLNWLCPQDYLRRMTTMKKWTITSMSLESPANSRRWKRGISRVCSSKKIRKMATKTYSIAILSSPKTSRTFCSAIDSSKELLKCR